MTQYLQIQIFNAGLQDNLCKEIMETAHGIFQATYEAALGLEVIQDENKPAKPIIVATTMLTAKEQEPVNAVWAHRTSFQNGTAPHTQNKNIQCQYCKFFRHMQCNCHKHKAARAPPLDTNSQVVT